MAPLKLLLHPTYFPNIATFSAIARYDICWEVCDNYQKQTFRNRTHICNDLGLHHLSIPIRHLGEKEGRQKYAKVLMDNNYKWQRNHWRTLQTSYRTSPFFEYYEDELAPLFERSYVNLMAFNLRTIETLCDCLQIKMPREKTTTYEGSPKDYLEGRFLVNAKNDLALQHVPYVQVFGDRNGFVGNLSILDLLFNEGTNAHAYLKNQNLDFLHA